LIDRAADSFDDVEGAEHIVLTGSAEVGNDDSHESGLLLIGEDLETAAPRELVEHIVEHNSIVAGATAESVKFIESLTVDIGNNGPGKS